MLEQQLQRNDATIHYQIHGDADTTLVFLHGWTASVREWTPFVESLAQHYRVVCWDARGHGLHSYAESTEMTLPAMADDLDALLNHLHIENTVLIGHSMGALTAWEYLSRHGQSRIKGLCIIDQSPRLVTDEQWKKGVYTEFCNNKNQAFLQRLEEDFAQGVLELIGQGMNQRSRENFEQNSRGFQQMRGYLEKLPAKLLTNCWQSITQQDYRDLLPRITIPTLLIYGDESQFYCAELQQWVHEQMKHASLHVYENSDHSPHLWHKERFITDLSNFVNAL